MMVLNLFTLFSFCQVSISSDNSLPDNSSMLDVKSQIKGILVPRMTASQRNSISSPATGLMIFCTDNNQYYYNQGTPVSPNWLVINSQWVNISSNIYFNTGNVGIGNTSPNSLLSVGTNNQFQVNTSGNITKINNTTTSWPSSQGTAGTFLQNDGSGNLSWTAMASTGLKQVIRGVITLSSNTTVSQSFSPSVVPSKCVVDIRFVGDGYTQPTDPIGLGIVSSLSSTLITIETGIFIGGLKLEYQIIEYY